MEGWTIRAFVRTFVHGCTRKHRGINGQAAEMGHAEAQFQFFQAFVKSSEWLRIEADAVEAAKWLKRAGLH